VTFGCDAAVWTRSGLSQLAGLFQWCITKNIGGIPLPSRLGGLGKRRELIQQGPGQPRPPKHSRHRPILGPQKPSSGHMCESAVYVWKTSSQRNLYGHFLASKKVPPKIGGPVRPNTSSNMPKAGPGVKRRMVHCYIIANGLTTLHTAYILSPHCLLKNPRLFLWGDLYLPSFTQHSNSSVLMKNCTNFNTCSVD